MKLAGLARGGGAEFVAAVDMAFAAEGRAGLAQCEALMGMIPCGGGTQYLGDRMTRGRPLETILGANLFDAKLAERYGWINRALPSDELDTFVSTLARHIRPAGRYHWCRQGSCARRRPCKWLSARERRLDELGVQTFGWAVDAGKSSGGRSDPTRGVQPRGRAAECPHPQNRMSVRRPAHAPANEAVPNFSWSQDAKS